MVATIKDIARRAGVTEGVVSTVLSGSKNNIRCAKATRKQILDAAREMNYLPNRLARTLATRRAHSIGVMVSDIGNPSTNLLIERIHHHAWRQGYSVILTLTKGDGHRGLGELRRLRSSMVEGVLCLDPGMSGHVLDEFRSQMSIVGPTEQWQNVRMDYRAAADEAVSHLRKLGHERIGLVSLRHDDPYDWEASIRRAMKRHGLEWTESRRFIPRDGETGWYGDAVEELVRRQRVTALVASNDQYALRLLFFLQKAGLAVPEDVSLVGRDDIPDAIEFEPALTTVRHDWDSYAGSLVMSLIGAIRRGEVGEAKLIPTELVIRDSCGPASRSTVK